MAKGNGSHDAIGDWRKRGLWTQQQLAESLGVSLQTVRKWRKEGMPCVRTAGYIFIFQSDFLKWLRQFSATEGGEK